MTTNNNDNNNDEEEEIIRVDANIKINELKTFFLLLSLLSKVSKEITFEFSEIDRNSAIALNDAKSSHLTVTLQREIFTSLKLKEDDDSFSFKLPVKPLCMTLKHLKGIDGLNFNMMSVGIEHIFNMNLTLNNGIKRKHKFHFNDVQSYNVVFSEIDANYVKASPQIFARILEHIPSSPEIYVYADANNFKVQSHSRIGSEAKKLSTELCIKTEEFDEYVYKSFEESVCIIFTIKEMKALLGVCEAKNIDEFYLFFTCAGSPIKFSCRSEFFAVSLVQMTISDMANKDDEKQSEADNTSNSKDRISETSRQQSGASQSQMSGKVSSNRKRDRRVIRDDDNEEEDEDNNENNNDNEYNDEDD